jgi:hypothetical protein
MSPVLRGARVVSRVLLRNCPHCQSRQRVAADQNHPKYDFLKKPERVTGGPPARGPVSSASARPGGAAFAEVPCWRVVRGPGGALGTGRVVWVPGFDNPGFDPFLTLANGY